MLLQAEPIGDSDLETVFAAILRTWTGLTVPNHVSGSDLGFD